MIKTILRILEKSSKICSHRVGLEAKLVILSGFGGWDGYSREKNVLDKYLGLINVGILCVFA
jgi:hypothetical protein